jgi:LDH2 family malate/lactate/ureidoglycolate dehydrogenase
MPIDTPMPAASRVQHGDLLDFVARALTAAGLPEADAHRVATLMTDAELQGSDGHGVIRLAPYLQRIRAGGMKLRPDIRIVHERSATALLDGDNGMGHLVMSRAAELAVQKARQCGIAWVGARLSNHAGPASLYARMALPQDMIGLYFAVGNANHLPPWGGLDMLLSTNPIAVAVPSADDVPVVLDMATTVAAYGKVKAKAQRGESMPEGWMIDRQGKPLCDPRRADEGFLLPIGGYKGYGLSLIVGLLAGTLNGAAMGREVIDFNKDFRSTTNTGQAIAMIDVAAFGDVAAFKQRVSLLVRDLRGSARMPGVDRIWLPGEQSHARRIAHLRDGIVLPAALRATLAGVATDLGIAPLP